MAKNSCGNCRPASRPRCRPQSRAGGRCKSGAWALPATTSMATVTPSVFLTSMSDNKLQVLDAGHGQPRYTDIAFKRGVTAHRPYVGGDVHPSTAWHAQFADVNNDGWADLFIAKGNVSTMPDFATLDPNNLLLQNAEGQFVEAGSAGRAGQLQARPWRHGGGPEWRRPAGRIGGQPLGQSPGVAPTARSRGERRPAIGCSCACSSPHGNRDAVGAWVEVRLGDGRKRPRGPPGADRGRRPCQRPPGLDAFWLGRRPRRCSCGCNGRTAAGATGSPPTPTAFTKSAHKA